MGRAGAQAAGSPARRQIEPLLDTMMLAANAHDTDRFLTVYLRQPTLVYVFNGVIIHGWDDLRAQQVKWWNNGKSDVVYTRRGAADFSVLGSDVVVVTMGLASHRTRASGEVQSGELAVTMVWRQGPEGWRIVQAHESTVH
jgi:uncharacterized protein (TIGR02246 family)